MPRLAHLKTSAMVAGLLVGATVLAPSAHAESNRRVCYQLFGQSLNGGTQEALVAIWGKTSIKDTEACGNIHAKIDEEHTTRLSQPPEIRPPQFAKDVNAGAWAIKNRVYDAPCEHLWDEMAMARDPCHDVEVSPGPPDSVQLYTTYVLVRAVKTARPQAG